MMKKERIASLLKTNLFISTMIMSCMFMLQSCSTQSSMYDINLFSVESPKDAKLRFGETKIVSFIEENQQKYRYEDDFINISWFVGYEAFYFTLANKTEHAIKINWDDISYVDLMGNVGRVMHSGVKYIEGNNSQPATSIPKKAKIEDILMPTSNVDFGSSGWHKRPLIPNEYNYGGADGKTMIIYMPLIIENVQNDYTFEFIIKANPQAGQTSSEALNNGQVGIGATQPTNNGKRLSIRYPETITPAYNSFRSNSIYNMSKNDKALTVRAFVSEIENDLKSASSWEDFEIINTKIKYLDQYSAIQDDLKPTVKLLKETFNGLVANIGG